MIALYIIICIIGAFVYGATTHALVSKWHSKHKSTKPIMPRVTGRTE